MLVKHSLLGVILISYFACLGATVFPCGEGPCDLSAILTYAQNWLGSGLGKHIDHSPAGGDGTVNLKDLLLVSKHWKDEHILPATDIWKKFEHAQTDILYDYSHAGYHQCQIPLPQVNSNSYTRFDITQFGAVPNDGLSDRQAILDALNAAQAHNGPAQVYFPPGRFRINELSDLGKPSITVTRNNIVLKGAGMALTELYADQPGLIFQGLINFNGPWPDSTYWRGDQKTTVTDRPAPGGYRVNVASTRGLNAGQIVNIDANLNRNTAAGQSFFAPHEVPDGIKDIEDYLIDMHTIKSVQGNSITFNEPIHLDLPHMESVQLRVMPASYFLQDSGIEDMTIISNYREVFKHHKGSRFGETFIALDHRHTMNCWARNIRLESPGVGIRVNMSLYNTFMNIILEGNIGHSPITLSYGYGNLFAYCRENHEGHHGFGGSHSASNSVFLRCNQYDGIEAHCAWIRASLYDMNQGGFKHRGGGAQKFPMHSKGLCFWNWNCVIPDETYDFWPLGSNYGYMMPPVIVGLHGLPFTIPDQKTDVLLLESYGQIVSPESLFEAQLERRLGTLPDWLNEQSQLFEAISRYSTLAFVSPQDYSTCPLGTPIAIKLATGTHMNTQEITRTELWASTQSRHDGFVRVGTFDGWKPSWSFTPDTEGTIIIKGRMINSRAEVAETHPRNIYCGNPDNLIPFQITKSAIMPGYEYRNLYTEFVSVGGGEAREIPNSTALKPYKDGTKPYYEVEQAYYQEKQDLYKSFGQSQVKPLLEKASNIASAATLIDDNLSTACPNIFGDLGSTLQFDLGSVRPVRRIDFIWNGTPPAQVKVDVQVSNDPDAWYSVTNDEPLWDWGIATIGTTLKKQPLPGDMTSSLFIPTRQCRYIRIKVDRFPNNRLAEVKIFGTLSAPTDYTETLENMTSSGWTQETYTGDNGFRWHINAKEVSNYINSSKCIYMVAGRIGIESDPIPAGISHFSVKCRNLWDQQTPRTMQLLINGQIAGSITHSGSDTYNFTVDNINISGPITIAVKNATPTGSSNYSVAIDDIQWTTFN